MKGSRIHLDLFKVFLSLAETKSFSRAAAINALTQSAVSQQLSALERLFGKKLIDRGKGRFALTEEGGVLLEGCRQILQTYHEVVSRIHKRPDGLSGTVKVETIYSIGLYELAPYVRTFLRLCPRVDLQIEHHRAKQIYADVIAGVCDIGVIADPRPHPQLKTIGFKKERLTIVTHPDHPLARRRSVRLKELNRQDFIAFSLDAPTRGIVDGFLSRHLARVRIVHSFDNIDTIKRAVEIGLGLSILPESNVIQETSSGTLSSIRIADGPLFRQTGIIVGKRRSLSAAARAFVRWLTAPDPKIARAEKLSVGRQDPQTAERHQG